MTGRSPRVAARRGQAMVEFTLVGIPIIFTLISIFEISRGMWNYHTLAYAAKSGVRYAVVHGQNCDPAIHPSPALNSCLATVGDVASVIRNAGVGLDLTQTTLTFFTLFPDGTVKGTIGPCTLTACQGNATQWPPNDTSNQKGNLVRIDVKTVFRSAIAMLWPGSTPISFSAVTLGASSSDTMQF